MSFIIFYSNVEKLKNNNAQNSISWFGQIILGREGHFDGIRFKKSYFKKSFFGKELF